MATAVIGRDHELGAIRAFFERLEDGPAVVVLSGEAGIGKTILWEAGLAAANSQLVLAHRSVEAESALPFIGLSDLLTPVIDDVAPSLAPPRRDALEAALLLSEPGEAGVNPAAVGLAVADALKLLALERPVVLAVDDLHWLDSSSAAVLQVALRRLGEEPVGFMATLRNAPEVIAPFDLERSFPEQRLRRLTVGPLSIGGIHHLLKERLELELSRPALVRVREATGGNPFFALELGRELMRANATPQAGTQMPLPDTLAKLLRRRLDGIGQDARDVLLTVAALPRPTVEVVSAAHSKRGGSLDALEAASRDGILERQGSRLRFTHPLFAAACYEDAPISKRRAVHGLLAGVVQDQDERARHLALATDRPGSRVAVDLEVAAWRAEARGAIAAAELWDLSAQRTPPREARTRRRRQLRAAQLQFRSGDPERGTALAEQLLADVPPGAERADVLFELAGVRRAPLPTLVARFEEALAAAEGDDARSARILSVLSSYRSAYDLRRGLADARAALAGAERAGDLGSVAQTIARVGYAETFGLEITDGLLERGIELETDLAGTGPSFVFYNSPRAMLGLRLMFRDDVDRARTILEEREAELAATGSEATRAFALFHLIVLEWLASRWSVALAHASTAIELTEQVHDELVRAWVLHAAALVRADLGHADEARRDAEEALTISRSFSDEVGAISSQGALGHLELALGNPTGAVGYLRELPARLVSMGWNEPSTAVWPDTIEALISVGELAPARSYLEQYEERARRASRRSLASSQRSAGLLAAAEGDTAAAVDAFEQSLRELRQLPYASERARTLLALGSVRRQTRQKRLAREALDESLAIFEDLGARLWAERARAELARVSGRRSASSDLTETERRIAEFAAEGRPNKEIAATLFISVRTVEQHLTHVYRKLGLHSRAELAHRLTRAAGSEAVKT
jgi:DNA-binding CsgD family transcriptional regulator